MRAGLVYEVDGVKTVVYLRPARNLDVRAIQGPARFILSDLRNDPFSPRKMVQLLTNLEAVREAILFKTKAGFRGDYYSVLLFGEQTPGRVTRPGRPTRPEAETELAGDRGGTARLPDRPDPLPRRVRRRHRRDQRASPRRSGSSGPAPTIPVPPCDFSTTRAS